MTAKYSEIMFTEGVKDRQTADGSREAYALRVGAVPASSDRIGEAEAAFIAERDSFYMASVSETGWPYVQHRGGPRGFLAVIDECTLAFADFRGNRQFISAGNLDSDDRVSLFLMDYANRRRLKIIGHARVVSAADEGELIAQLSHPTYRARVERAVIITVTAFDWNCPQHITPRFSEAEVQAATRPLLEQLNACQARADQAVALAQKLAQRHNDAEAAAALATILAPKSRD